MKLSLRTKLFGILLLTGARPPAPGAHRCANPRFSPPRVGTGGHLPKARRLKSGVTDLQLLLERDVKNLSYLVILANLPALVEGATKAPVPADLEAIPHQRTQYPLEDFAAGQSGSSIRAS